VLVWRKPCHVSSIPQQILVSKQLLFSQKLGAIPSDISEAIRGLNDIKQIRKILAQYAAIKDWQTLRNHLN